MDTMQKINLLQLQKLALFGMGTSIYQLSRFNQMDLGSEPNQWDLSIQNQKIPPPNNLLSPWETLEMYLPILQSMGIQHLRFSVEWNYIEPQPGQFNQEAIFQYQKILEKCLLHGIEPMLTLYHFTQPKWFKDKGGFIKDENITYFIRYCMTVINALQPFVKMWCTINEPAVEVFSGYLYGQFPPHQRIRLNKAAHILKNMLLAHVELCHHLDKKHPQKHLKIGLVHNILRFESSSYLIKKFLTDPLTHFTDELITEFMATGHLKYRQIDYYDDRFKGNCCFVNIYGSVQIGYLGPDCQKHQKMGDMYIAIYPESYDLALEKASQFQLPIYITETGIADEHDKVRPEFIIHLIRSVIKQVSLGQDIQRIYFWTFKDNYEWNEGHEKKFGFFTQEDRPRTSAYLLTWVIQNFKAISEKHLDPQKIIAEWNQILDIAEQKIKNNQLEYFSKFIKL
jgi:beta-glucosidase